MVRIVAAVSVLLFGALLAWVAVANFNRPAPIVVPTNGVIASGIKDPLPTGPEARQALAERTQLQRWRAESGPSPAGATTEQRAAAGAAVPRTGGQSGDAASGPQLTREWLAARDRDWPVLDDRGYTAGKASLPAARDSVFMQPQGRDFRRLQKGGISYSGAWIIFGMSLLLSIFLLLRGRIRVAKGFSGETVERFSGVERANHWMTASSFVVLGLSGLILIYGWRFLQPLMGSRAYGTLAQGNVYVHIASAAPFILGITVMAVLWLRQNLPSKLDLHWLARFGGFFSTSGDTPHARRFNAGQKIVFWGVVLGGVLMFISGVTLMFPFYWGGVQTMQLALLGHGLLALLMVALILGHIYIGTVGMEGAFDAMWSGQVDRNWAEEHHDLWLAEIEGKHREGRPPPVPAE